MTVAALITEGIGPGSSILFLMTGGLGTAAAPAVTTVVAGTTGRKRRIYYERVPREPQQPEIRARHHKPQPLPLSAEQIRKYNERVAKARKAADEMAAQESAFNQGLANILQFRPPMPRLVPPAVLPPADLPQMAPIKLEPPVPWQEQHNTPQMLMTLQHAIQQADDQDAIDALNVLMSLGD